MVYGLWFMVYGLWFMVYGFGRVAYGLWFIMVYGLWFMVYGLWFLVFGRHCLRHTRDAGLEPAVGGGGLGQKSGQMVWADGLVWPKPSALTSGGNYHRPGIRGDGSGIRGRGLGMTGFKAHAVHRTVPCLRPDY